MEIKETDDEGRFEPSSRDDSILCGMMFEKITAMWPDLAMHHRSDLAMALFVVVKKWAHDLELTSDSHRIVETNVEIPNHVYTDADDTVN